MNQKAWLESSLFLPTPSYGLCFDFWYHMYGTGMGSLSFYINSSETLSLLWTQNGNKGNQWLNGQVSVKSSKSFRIVIEAVRGSSYLSDAAIDDLDFIEKSCNTVPESADPINNIRTTTIPTTTTLTLRPSSKYDCDFEKNTCIWSTNNASTFNFERVQGTKGNQVIGPITVDNTLGTPDGWYLYANIANRRPTDFALVETSLITGSQCMEFYYFFYVSGKFTFNIYVSVNNQNGVPIWTRSTSQGELWRLGRVTVSSGSSYKVLLEVRNILNGAVSDKVAIDDVFFSNGPCQDSSNVNSVCSFSGGNLCEYNLTTGKIPWALYDPSQLRNEISLRGGPITINDHTSGGSGSGYVYLNTLGYKTNDTAIMTSKLYTIQNQIIDGVRCLEFYYYLEGKKSVTLNVSASTLSPRAQYLLWTRDYDHGQFWWKAEANVKILNSYNLLFQAIVGTNPGDGLVGLDDISLRNGECTR